MSMHEELTQTVKGLKCTGVELYAPESWSFKFQGSFGLNVQCPWRLVNEHGIALSGQDHLQIFGLPAPVDAQVLAMQILSGRRLIEVNITEKTGDIRLAFESDIYLEVFNNSMGYEGWNYYTLSGVEVIGLGGGGTANVRAGKHLLSK